jgi:hypothetical protein
VATWKAFNPEYEYRLYTDDEMEVNMREWYPELMSAWVRMRPVEKVNCIESMCVWRTQVSLCVCVGRWVGKWVVGGCERACVGAWNDKLIGVLQWAGDYESPLSVRRCTRITPHSQLVLFFCSFVCVARRTRSDTPFFTKRVAGMLTLTSHA